MSNLLVEIQNPKKINQEIEEEIVQQRKKLKNKFKEEENSQDKIEKNRIELFKPIIESNEKLCNEIIENKNKTKINDTIEYIENLKINTSTENNNLIDNYLKDKINRSNAKYSIKYDSENDQYIIGNKIVEIENNNFKINDKIYEGTSGLLELLIKKSPNFNIISETDKDNYKQILDDSNAIYKNFDTNSKRLNADSSDKWKFIKNNLINDKNLNLDSPKTSNEKNNDSINQSIDSFINESTSDFDLLIEDLKVSINNYKSGNHNEHSKITSILDQLTSNKIIKKSESNKILKNIKK